MKLTALKDLYATSGPFVTVFAEIGRADAQAEEALHARWTSISRELEGKDVDPKLVTLLGERFAENRRLPGAARLTLVASGGEVALETVQVGESAVPESTDVGLLPDLSGWLVGEDGSAPYAVVVVDRTGADVDFFTGAGQPVVESDEAAGESEFDTHLAEGAGESKEQGHQSEETFRANAEEIAETVLSGVRRHRPRVVVLAGDAQTRAQVAEALEAQDVEVAQTDAGGRGVGASTDALATAVEEILARYEAAEEQDVLDRLANVNGANAARGLDHVLDALVQGQVDTLVMDLDEARALTVDPETKPGLALPASVGDATQPADRVLMAAAALTDASVVLLPASQTGGLDGIHAVLRWS